MYKFCHCLTKPIITRIIVSLAFKNVIIRTAVFRDYDCFQRFYNGLWLNQRHENTNFKFCHYLTKPIITRIIVSLKFKNVIRACKAVSAVLFFMYLVFENVIIRIEIIVFRDFMNLVKHDQILSLFNQAYYHTNYCVFNV